MTWRFYDNVTGLLGPSSMLLPSAAAVAANTPAGSTAIEGDFDYLSQRVDLAAVTAKQAAIAAAQAALAAAGTDFTAQAAAQAQLTAALALVVIVDYQPPAPANDPNQTWAWSAQLKRWQATPTLAAVKALQWANIKAQAALSDQADIVIGVGTYAADSITRALLFQAAQLAVMNNSATVNWQLTDGTPITLTLAQLKAGVTALGARSAQIMAKAVTLHTAILAAPDAATVQAILWSWP